VLTFPKKNRAISKMRKTLKPLIQTALSRPNLTQPDAFENKSSSNQWLMKSEPNAFSIDDLVKRKTACWDGVRNYQVRNWLRDAFQMGDQAFFYHSSCETPGITGIMEIIKAGYPDQTAFNPEDPHYDPKSDPDNPRWYCVDVRLLRKFKRIITLAEIRQHPILHEMLLLQKGSRLSITPVTTKEWDTILALEKP
jgi:predicted RNA-binding protein with PUA-like domain